MSRTIETSRFVTKSTDSYLKLIHQFPLRPIRNRADYAAASKMIDLLAVRGEDDLDRGEMDYLDVLSDLVKAYDDRHCVIPPDTRPPHEKLRSLMEQNGMNQAELASLLGVVRSLASLILSGQRKITVAHAKKLGERFRLDAGYFL
jgi:HTH-type transcriptional regulator/antitoxin HigA